MRFFAPQGRHVAPMGVKFGMEEGEVGKEVGRDEGRELSQKYDSQDRASIARAVKINGFNAVFTVRF